MRRGVAAWPLALGLGCASGGETGDTFITSLPADSGPESSGSGDTSSDTSASTTTAGTVDSSGSTAATSVDEDSTGDSIGQTDTGCVPQTWYLDADGDGFGTADSTTQACTMPAGYSGTDDDCDDDAEDVNPSLDEICDGKDNDCDLLVDEGSASNDQCQGCTVLEENGRGYYLCPNGVVWDAARTFCMNNFAAELIKIDDANENNLLVGLSFPASGVPGGWSIGLSDEGSEGTFSWTDGVVAAYTNWLPGEPNNTGGVENCGEMSPGDGTWNDVPCNDLRSFICESPPP